QRINVGGVLDHERAVIGEAIRRGGDFVQLNQLFFELSRRGSSEYSLWRSDDAIGLQASGTAFTLQMDADLIQRYQDSFIREEQESYRRIVDAEFNSLPHHIQEAFGGSGKKPPRDPTEKARFY